MVNDRLRFVPPPFTRCAAAVPAFTKLALEPPRGQRIGRVRLAAAMVTAMVTNSPRTGRVNHRKRNKPRPGGDRGLRTEGGVSGDAGNVFRSRHERAVSTCIYRSTGFSALTDYRVWRGAHPTVGSLG
jgi:hypothetical protein